VRVVCMWVCGDGAGGIVRGGRRAGATGAQSLGSRPPSVTHSRHANQTHLEAVRLRPAQHAARHQAVQGPQAAQQRARRTRQPGSGGGLGPVAPRAPGHRSGAAAWQVRARTARAATNMCM
jgi:hypothetical protein